MKLIKPVVYITFFMLLFSCNKTTGPVLPDVTTTKADLSNFQTILADYGSVVFKSNEELLLKNKDVTEIILGKMVDGVFTPIDTSSAPEKTRVRGRIYKRNSSIAAFGEKTIKPIYTKVGDKYRLEFEISIKVNNTTYLEHYLLKFIMTDDTYIEFDLPVNFYQYPYENSQIFLQYTHGQNGDLVDIIQDFDVVGDYLYYHPYAALGLFRYNMNTGESKELLGYAGGDHIATTDDYIFCDIGHHYIIRYNILRDTTDIIFDMQQIEYCHYQDGDPYCSNLSIYGLAAGNGVVYAIMFDQSDEKLSLSQFDYDGNYWGSVLWSEEYPYNLEYHDGVLYSYKYFFGEGEILRFDINSMSFLESKPLPSASPDGISIVNDRFYYADYYRHLICSIPIYNHF
jgi:hypothetical protein